MPSDTPTETPSSTATATPSTAPTTPVGPAFRYVFVSSDTSNGNLGGLAGADARCRALADASTLGAGKLNGRSWVAWLSTTSPLVHARDRIPDSEYRWVDDVTTVATSKADLLAGLLSNAITADENGVIQFGATWTGTTNSGTASPSTRNCFNWATSGSALRGEVGNTTGLGNWSDAASTTCNTTSLRLYCFEVGP